MLSVTLRDRDLKTLQTCERNAMLYNSLLYKAALSQQPPLQGRALTTASFASRTLGFKTASFTRPQIHNSLHYKSHPGLHNSPLYKAALSAFPLLLAALVLLVWVIEVGNLGNQLPMHVHGGAAPNATSRCEHVN